MDKLVVVKKEQVHGRTVVHILPTEHRKEKVVLEADAVLKPFEPIQWFVHPNCKCQVKADMNTVEGQCREVQSTKVLPDVGSVIEPAQGSEH